MKKIAVTGATGFLGRATCLRLKQHYEVVGLGRNPELGQKLEAEGIRFVSCDLSDEPSLNAAFAGADAVVHCAARSSPWGRITDFQRDNVEGTQKVVDACLEQKVGRLVHISSPSIYFELRDRFGIKESDPIAQNMLNAYAISKWAAEQVVDTAVRRRGLEAITLRPQAIFGPGDTAIIPRLIEANSTSGIPIFAGRSPWLDITYVENVAYAIELALTAPVSACAQHYNITNDEPLELLPYLEVVLSRLGTKLRRKPLPYRLGLALAHVLERAHERFWPNKEPLLTPYKIGVLSHSRTLDISLAKAQLGYRPLWTVEAGTDAFVKWWDEELSRAPVKTHT